ncbi:MAG: hypothetical protein Q7I98_01155 [Erysipelotrichaceae bacterium]|nr:hypothetical protein [Erysipelotrichaceae bacterium]
MSDLIYDQFQNTVQDVLIRHVSILDIITKLEESNSRINRATVKTITSCGCLNLHAEKPEIPEDAEYKDIKAYADNQLRGELCSVCREKIDQEIGTHLFYLAALCNHLNINLYDAFLHEYNQIKTLGPFSLY